VSNNLSFPVTTINGREWILLGRLDRVITFRAVSINKKKQRVQESTGHHFDEAIAEGSVKFTSKREWNIKMYKQKSDKKSP
jgi:hypothetical protein